MSEKSTTRIKQAVSFIFIIFGMILVWYTNNNPITFGERIFRPIKLGFGTFYYAAIIPVLLLYYGLKGINLYVKNSVFRTTMQRIITIIILLMLSTQLCNYGIKISKKMSTGLNSIYYYRVNSNNLMFGQSKNNKTEITCSIELENCSKNSQEFYIELLIPRSFQEYFTDEKLLAKEDNQITNKKIILKSKERKVVSAMFLANPRNNSSGVSGNSNYFEFLLLNSKEKVKFSERI
jgi:hypothetical protein